jgi:hypothetical protein
MGMTKAKRSAFARRNTTYGIRMEYDGREEHARALAHGCDLLGPGFACEPCGLCRGKGVSKYSNGFACDFCCGTGLTQANGAAPAFCSQRRQVLVAASRSMLLNFEVEVL